MQKRKGFGFIWLSLYKVRHCNRLLEKERERDRKASKANRKGFGEWSDIYRVRGTRE